MLSFERFFPGKARFDSADAFAAPKVGSWAPGRYGRLFC